MTTVAVPICYSCAYLHLQTGGPMTCDAFPAGIPAQIIESEVDHRLPFAGDQGIQFRQNPARPEPDPLVFEGEP